MHKDLDNHVIRAIRVIDKFSLQTVPGVRGYIYSDLSKHIASQIVGKMTEETRDAEFATEFRLSVYVFKPDEFWGIVHQKAMEMNNRMNMNARARVDYEVP